MLETYSKYFVYSIKTLKRFSFLTILLNTINYQVGGAAFAVVNVFFRAIDKIMITVLLKFHLSSQKLLKCLHCSVRTRRREAIPVITLADYVHRAAQRKLYNYAFQQKLYQQYVPTVIVTILLYMGIGDGDGVPKMKIS